MRIAVKILAVVLLLLLLAYLWFRQETASTALGMDAVGPWFEQAARRPDYARSDRAPCRDTNPLNKAYFGELHVHTAVSADAYGFGVSKLPDDFYRFARGEEIELRLQSDSGAVPVLKLDRPLDFAAVTDHANSLGEQALCLDLGFENRNSLVCKVFRGEWTFPVEERMHGLIRMLALIGFGPRRSTVLCGEDGRRCLEKAGQQWDLNQQAAERWYDRSEACEFTSFVGYEYTLARQASNLHRNVIFKNAVVPPMPLSMKEVQQAELLWEWLDTSCAGSGNGCDAITIPHNSNWSSGRMFLPYSQQSMPEADKRRYAQLRNAYEVLAETMQVKGDSECRNGLSSVLGGADEFCDFEKLRAPEEAFEDCGESPGSGGMRLAGCLSQYSYTRYALAAGLEELGKLGVNPFKFGMVAATDSHNAAGGAVAEDNYHGATGSDRDRQARTSPMIEVPGGIAKGSPVQYNPGGLAGVWARENSRDALFAAMRKRETFGTSGPRIEPRFFAAWELDEQLCEREDMLQRAYDQAVPMGSDLPPAMTSSSAPMFLVNALQDAGGLATPLQRVQVVKTWSDEQGRTHQRVFDVAGSPDNGASVNPQTCERSGSGHARLCAIWRDPEFDSDTSAVYYARVLENPSCRWLAYDCLRAEPGSRPLSCDDPGIRKTLQERAWTSPIWYNAPG